jgi:hypothetical protein
MNDEFVRGLQRDWQSREQDVGETLRRLRRKRWVPHIVLGLELLGYAMALAVGVWFASVALRTPEHRLLFALSAAILLTTAPALGIASAMARRDSLAWGDETPESILQMGIRRANSSLRMVRVGQWHTAIVAMFVALLWLLQFAGWVDAFRFLVLYSLICFAVSLGSWLWMSRQSRKARAEQEQCRRLLAALQVEREAQE